MTGADATELAPKKNWLQPTGMATLCRRGHPLHEQLSASLLDRTHCPKSIKPKKPHFLLVNLPSGGLGYKTPKIARLLPPSAPLLASSSRLFSRSRQSATSIPRPLNHFPTHPAETLLSPCYNRHRMGYRRTTPAAARSIEPLLSIADLALPFTSGDGQPFVRLKYGTGGIYAVPVRSQSFREWFLDEYYRQHGDLPSSGDFRRVVHHLEAKASADSGFSRLSVWRRIGSRGDSRIPTHILLDLANPNGNIVEISPAGWKIVLNTTSFFQISRSTFDLPNPQQPAGPTAAILDRLRSRLNLATRADWLRCLAWLVSAFFPYGPFPILVFRGPSGSGKSTAARLLRYLIDPSSAPFTPIPHNLRQLPLLAHHNWILAFDHISTLSDSLADALCRLTSGAGISIPETTTPDPARDPILHFCRRPILLTSTAHWTPPEDLARRALTINFAPISAGHHLPESTIIDSFAQDYSALTGALCSVVAAALDRAASVPLSTMYPWPIAAAPALGCSPEEIADAMGQSAPHPFVQSLATLLYQAGPWSGSPTNLLQVLPKSDLYHSPKGLTQLLNKLQPDLTAAGIRAHSHRQTDGTRIIEISDASCQNAGQDASKQPPQLLQPPESKRPAPPCDILH